MALSKATRRRPPARWLWAGDLLILGRRGAKVSVCLFAYTCNSLPLGGKRWVSIITNLYANYATANELG